MHDKEIRVVDVQLDRLEKILNSLLLRTMSIDQILARSSKHDLSGNADLLVLLETDWGVLLIGVVEYNRNTGFGDTCLTALVDEILDSLVNRRPSPAFQESARIPGGSALAQ